MVAEEEHWIEVGMSQEVPVDAAVPLCAVSYVPHGSAPVGMRSSTCVQMVLGIPSHSSDKVEYYPRLLAQWKGISAVLIS